jgi:hypothetical protein
LQDNASGIKTFSQLCQSVCSVAITDLIVNGSFGDHSSPKELSYAEIFVLSAHFQKSLLARLGELGFVVNRRLLERKLGGLTITNCQKEFALVERRKKTIQCLKAPALFLQSNTSTSPSPATIVEVNSFATVSTILS